MKVTADTYLLRAIVAGDEAQSARAVALST